MYESFFGLAGEPFAVAPDPRFLYLSDPHREALSHLEIGLRGAGGFVLLTGEIGAGKTTVWRSFLEQLPPSFDVATVVNPRLGVEALLARLCDDLGVELPDGPARDPIDALHGHLLLAHAQGRRTLIAIDEAQALSDEVLEQLRLLTNLVTGDRKLLQVLLIGQPELLDMLARPALEPLAQRIVARYHLPALTEHETRRYIAHRLAVAGTGGALPFDDDALARIHAHCGGVPRRINVLCDRTLLSAWQARVPRVAGDLVDRVAHDVFGRPDRAMRADPPPDGDPLPEARTAATIGPPIEAQPDPRMPWFAAAAALVIGLLVSPWLRQWLAGPVPPAAAVASAPEVSVPLPATTPPRPAVVVDSAPVTPPLPLADLFARPVPETAAWRTLGNLFGLRLTSDDPCAQAAALGWQCFREVGGVAQIRSLDRPVLLGLQDDQGRQTHVVAVGLSDGQSALHVQGWAQPILLAQLALAWPGGLATLWQPPPGYEPGQTRVDDGSALARWVQDRLAQVDGAPDRPLGQRVLAFQRAQGLAPDGVIGPRTLMALGRVGDTAGPRLLSP